MNLGAKQMWVSCTFPGLKSRNCCKSQVVRNHIVVFLNIFSQSLLFYGLFSWTAWSRHNRVAVASAGPYAVVIYTSLQTDNHASTSSLSFYQPDVFLLPNRQRQNTEDTSISHSIQLIFKTHQECIICFVWCDITDWCLQLRTTGWVAIPFHRSAVLRVY